MYDISQFWYPLAIGITYIPNHNIDLELFKKINDSEDLTYD